MKLLDLNDVLWKAYPGAYGSVREEVGVLMGEPAGPEIQLRRLKEAAEDEEHLAFDNLCENLSHQMTFYDAMYVALPYFVKFLERKSGDYDWQRLIFSEAGHCLATEAFREGGGAAPDILASYREAADILAEKAEAFLKTYRRQLRKEGAFERRWLCTGLLGLLGDRREAYAIIMNTWETAVVQCGACGYLDEDLELFTAKQRRKLHPLRPWQKQPPQFRRFRKILHDMGDWEGEELLADYYGDYTCPHCKRRQPVMEAMIRAFDPAFQPPEEAPPKEPGGASGPRKFRIPAAAPVGPESPEPEAEEPPAPRPDVLEDNALTRAPDLCREAFPSLLDLTERGEFREAADWCGRYLASAPDWRLHAFRAYCYRALKKYPEMDRCLTAALELDPDNVLLLRARCPTVSTVSRYRRHVEDLTRLLELDPENRGSYLVSRAYRRHWTGDRRGAAQDLRDALAAEPDLPDQSADFRHLWSELDGSGNDGRHS